jgi:ubiquinone/menaquinone biosynthesis C-methylase UbiE
MVARKQGGASRQEWEDMTNQADLQSRRRMGRDADRANRRKLTTRTRDHNELPAYPTWIRSNRIIVFWLVAAGIIMLGAGLMVFWLPGLALTLLALPFLYIALVLTLASYRLGPRGGDLQARIHQLVIDSVGGSGRLLDVGCGSGQLLIRFAKSAPGDYVGLDHWGNDWEYSQAQCVRNAELESATEVQFVRGSASRLPFSTGEFGRVVSCLTFHEVHDVADTTASLLEALRVLAPGGGFAFVDLFDDPGFYAGREKVLAAVANAGGTIETARSLSEVFDLKFPLNLAKVLKYAVIVTGTKSRATTQMVTTARLPSPDAQG